MAYQAKRRKKFEEDFELVDEHGEVVHTLHVALDADDMTVKISRKYTALTNALFETTEMKRKAKDANELKNCIETLGRAVTDIFEAVFGKEDAQTIIDFYENRYVEMAKEVIPFISQVVLPRMIEMRKENTKQVLAGYNRSQRRKIFGRMK